ncbi:MAG TPA: MFS transporter, partial [Myxococcaceae bacterium]|nr:MFS transporter [Myxococcaceae bacterium]
IGNVMMGLMLGILFARPWGSLVGDAFGWRAVDGLAAVAIAVLTVTLALLVPEHRPLLRPRYPVLVRSMWMLFREEPVLRYRALASALSFGAFSVFWTTVALRLVRPPFNLGQHGIAVFALAGVGGVFTAPLAGRAGDRGLARPLILLAHASIVVAAGLAALAGTGVDPLGHHWLLGLAVLSLASIVLDMGVVADQTLGRRAILLLRPEAAGRLNGLFTGSAFVGGGLGAALAGLAWTHGGWPSTCLLAGALGLAALLRDCLDRTWIAAR